MQLSKMMRKLRQWLRDSPHVHIREQPVGSLTELVALIDRFNDGTLRYPLEWDDFVSWESEDPGIEEFRNRIADLEPLFFSSDVRDRNLAIERLMGERNRAAAFVGRPVRDKYPLAE